MRCLRWTTPRSVFVVLIVLIALGPLGPFVRPAMSSAAQSQDASRQQLKERFESRYQQLAEAKRSGRAGETWQGFVAVVERGAVDGAVQRLVDEENADRRTLYRLLARDIAAELSEPERSRMSPRVVAERNAWRNFERAGATEQLRVAEQTWVTKSERPWLLRLLELERQGRIGEARDGDVAPGPAGAAAEGDVDRVVELENAARRAFRARLEREEGLSAAQIAARQAKRHAAAVHLGVLVQSADGTWQPSSPRAGE